LRGGVEFCEEESSGVLRGVEFCEEQWNFCEERWGKIGFKRSSERFLGGVMDGYRRRAVVNEAKRVLVFARKSKPHFADGVPMMIYSAELFNASHYSS
jgi:hypothetical protein